MPTFNELQQRMSNAKFRKTILTYLVEHIDKTFVPASEGSTANVLLTDDQVKVPVEMFEAVIADTLSPEIQQIDQEIAHINGTELVQAQPQSEAAPPQPEGTEATTKKTKPKEKA